MNNPHRETTRRGVWLLSLALLGASNVAAARAPLFRRPSRELKRNAQFLQQAQTERLPIRIQRSYAKLLRAGAIPRRDLKLGDGGAGTVSLRRGDGKLIVGIDRPNANIRWISRFYRYPGAGEKRATLQGQLTTYSSGLRVYTAFDKGRSSNYSYSHVEHDRIDHLQPRFSGASKKPDRPDLLRARRIKRPLEIHADGVLLAGSLATFCGGVGATACGGFGPGMTLLATSANLFVGGLYYNSRR